MNPFGAFRRDLQPVNDDVVLRALEPGHQPVPLVLNESWFASHTLGQSIRKIHFESDDSRRIPRVSKTVRRTALRISGPNKFLRRSHSRRRDQHEQEKVRNGFHDLQNLQ